MKKKIIILILSVISISIAINLFLAEIALDISTTADKIEVMQTFGVPYPSGYADKANADVMSQANAIAADLEKNGVKTAPNTEMIALIAYLQRLGKDIHVAATAQK